MFKAKAGLLGLDQYDRKISTKGSIADIRKHSEEAIPYGGIPQLANLGSQNAIGGTNEPPTPIVRLTDAIEKIAGTEAKFINSVEAEFIKPKKSLIGGTGGRQSETSKMSIELDELKKEDAIRKEKTARDMARDEKASLAVAPKTVPPFNLDTAQGKTDVSEWVKYLQTKFWRLDETDEGGPADLVYNDSVGYTKFLNDRNKTLAKIRKYYDDHPLERFFDAIMPMLVSLGHLGLDFMTNQLKTSAKAADPVPSLPAGTEEDPLNKERREARDTIKSILPIESALDKAKDFIKNILPKKYTSYEEGTKALLNAVLDAKPTWRARMQKDSDKAFQEWTKQFTDDISNAL